MTQYVSFKNVEKMVNDISKIAEKTGREYYEVVQAFQLEIDIVKNKLRNEPKKVGFNKLDEYIKNNNLDVDYFKSKPGQDLYEEYERYCSLNKIKKLTKKEFDEEVLEKYKGLITKKPRLRYTLNNERVQRTGFR